MNIDPRFKITFGKNIEYYTKTGRLVIKNGGMRISIKTEKKNKPNDKK